MEPGALSLPFLVLAGIAALRFALGLRGVPREHALEWWIALAVVALGAGLVALLAADLTGLAAFGLVFALLIAPARVGLAANRALRGGAERRAQALALLAVLLHPTRAFRERPRFFRLLLALRAGQDPAPAEIEHFRRSDPELAGLLPIFAAHIRGDIPVLEDIFADPAERARLLAGGFGLAYLRVVGLTAADPAPLLAALGEAERRDPTFQSADVAALLAVFFPAYAGDVDATRAHVDGLRAYLAPGEGPSAIAVALARRGDLEAALAALDDAARRVAGDRYAANLVAVYRRVLVDHTVPAPAPTPALERVLAKLDRDAQVLATLATLEGRSADHLRLTWTIAAALVAAYVALVATGDALDPYHLYELGALFTADFTPAQSWRLLTSTLLHAGLPHLAFNLVGLRFFGRFVEPFYGPLRAAALYLAAGALSGYSVVRLADPEAPQLLVGASGAIFGLGGAMLAALLTRPVLRGTRRGRSQIRGLLILFGLQVILDLMVAQISSTAHIAGVIAGFVLGLALAPRPR